MNCLSELTYAIYCDDELPPEEARQVELHLEACANCRTLVEALREENRALTLALQQTEEALARVVASAPRFHFLLGAGIFIVALAALPSLAINWMAQQFPTHLGWLDPMNLSGQINLIDNVVVFLAKNGVTMLSQFNQLSSIPVMALLVVLGALTFAHFRTRLWRPGLALLMLLVLAVPGFSLEIRQSKTVVTVAASETLDDTLIAGGDSVRVEGTINGDLIACARRVEVRGKIKGDLIVCAQKVEISGAVGGNVFSFAQSLDLRGHVENNMYAYMSSLYLSTGSQIGGNLVIGAADLTIEGTVMKSILVGTGMMDLKGTVGRDLSFYGGQLTVTEPARIGGSLTAHVSTMQHVNIASGVSIGGKNEILLTHHKNRYLQLKFYFWKAINVLGVLLVGLILWLLAPKFLQSTTQSMRSWGRSLGLGFAVLVCTPVALIILAITLVGLPLALIGAALYVGALFLTKIFVGMFLGQLLLKSSSSNAGGFLLALLVGLLILSVIFEIPYGIGAILHLLVFCFGLGALSWQIYHARRTQTS
jgi:hypothetical protein